MRDFFQTWLSQPKRRALDLIAWAFAAFLISLAWPLLHQPTTINLVLFAVIIYGAAKVVYEFTIVRGRVPTIATGFFERRRIAQLLKEDAAGKNNYTVLDLGAGRGELTRAIARALPDALPDAKVIGIELATLPHFQARALTWFRGIKNVTHLQQDIFNFDTTGADAVVLFLGKLTEPVGDKLYKELKPGTLVISNAFQLNGNWGEPQIITLHTPFKSSLLVYRR